MEPEERLWRAVVVQAAMDASSASHKTKLEVVLWTRDGDFGVVCGLAGLTASKIKDKLEEIFCADGIRAKYLSALLRDDILLETKEVF